ncbi:o-succinylbenzoate synthase [Thermosporothrix hazakensis]|jgi:o-succinylbenzoate synthase|uniref:o-succinylbenzoate synthase n=1 Tax=Thermosporothrix hazakensis TaxID=644383 RepID=A0A326UD06_THEHA|nr:o-succinylbenzoate synthase [Thermosporothrix hazakensis]PZW36482.1 o-succinylbenzoate synthase [Thermosporothrix hazakensis]GCE47136.1 hydrophobic dipeptide epimerase [Thermosporothrix hazakensis]
MSIVDILCHPYRIPLRTGVSTAHGKLAVRSGAILGVRSASGHIGYGDAAPLADFHAETLASVLQSLTPLLTQLQGREPLSALSTLYNLLDSVKLPSATVFGLEVALLDLVSKMRGVPLYSQLLHDSGKGKSAIPVNAVIGASGIDETVQAARMAVQRGFRCLKLKVANGLSEEDEIARIAAVRQAVGSDVGLRLDANEHWDFERAVRVLNACASYDIQYVEQPFRAYDLDSMYRLRQEVAIPVAADEAVYNLENARRIVAWEAADILIIKPQMTGGLYMSRQIIHEATRHNVQCVVTDAMESGIGVVATLHLAAASPEVTLPCGLATLDLLADDLLLEALPVEQGSMTVPAGPGLGMSLDQDALKKYAVKEVRGE